MQITLAQALKEKNRLAGEIRLLWERVQKENSKRVDETRSIDVRETLALIDLYTDKLVELKTKIGIANAGSIKSIFKLEECKSKLSKLEGMNTEDTPFFMKFTSGEVKEVKREVVVSAREVQELQHQLQMVCNRLQDELDTYNALNKIDFETPLR